VSHVRWDRSARGEVGGEVGQVSALEAGEQLLEVVRAGEALEAPREGEHGRAQEARVLGAGAAGGLLGEPGGDALALAAGLAGDDGGGREDAGDVGVGGEDGVWSRAGSSGQRPLTTTAPMFT
jgi:hypothetical protein